MVKMEKMARRSI